MRGTVCPPCPRHPTGSVCRDGYAGRARPGYFRRQRYCCTRRGGVFHRFVEPTPRRLLQVAAECDVCERVVPVALGPHTPRHHQFTVLEVATALQAVGAGETYRSTSGLTRTRIHRPARVPPLGLVHSPQPALVEDWVEVFGPVVTGPHRPTAWPRVLVVDELPFNLSGGPGQPGGVAAFTVLAALGYLPDRSRRIWQIRAYPGRSFSDWVDFYAQLPGKPEIIVCDGGLSVAKGIRSTWPAPQTPLIWISHYHLAAQLEKALGITHPLRSICGHAMTSLHAFEQFRRRLTLPRDETALRWMTRHAERIEWQFENAGYFRNPLSTGALETQLTTLKGWLYMRRGSFRNQTRTNRLLELMALQLNHEANVGEYRRTLLAHVQANAGRARTPRRAILDPLGHGSLR